MRQLAFQDEGDRLETAMRVRTKRKAAVVRRIDLRAVVIEEQERVHLRHARTRKRAAGDEVADVVAVGGMLGDYDLGGHGGPPCRAYNRAPGLAEPAAARFSEQ
jgi:hypothetical protein